MTNHPDKFARLVARLSQYDLRQLDAVEDAMGRIEKTADRRRPKRREDNPKRCRAIALPRRKDWPRASIHRIGEGRGTFIVTAGTLHKQHFLCRPALLDYFQNELLKKATDYRWHVEAWAIFSNHYHFVGHALGSADSLGPMLNHLHSDTARRLNEIEDQPGRQVWYNFWETKLTYEKSYQARLHYVHYNPVKHGLVPVANQYHWCSAAWFERTATPAQVKTIYGFKIDRLNVLDDFEPITPKE